MKVIKSAFVATLIVWLFTACNSDNGPFNCTDELVYGLSVTLRDATNNDIITENVTVIARDGDYEEELMIFPEDDTFFGAGERPGTYIIEVMSPNYQPYSSSPIIVNSDQCHVIAEIVEILLQPN